MSSLENHKHQGKRVSCRQRENIYRITKLRATSLSLWFSCILAVLDLQSTKIENIPKESKVFNVFSVWGMNPHTRLNCSRAFLSFFYQKDVVLKGKRWCELQLFRSSMGVHPTADMMPQDLNPPTFFTTNLNLCIMFFLITDYFTSFVCIWRKQVLTEQYHINSTA